MFSDFAIEVLCVIYYHLSQSLSCVFKVGKGMLKIFNNNRYITRGIKEKINEINPVIFLTLWQLIDELEIEKKDYLQVFTLRKIFGKRNIQEVIHTQENPEYRSVTRFYSEMAIDAKVFVIDDGSGNSTMMLNEEY